MINFVISDRIASGLRQRVKLQDADPLGYNLREGRSLFALRDMDGCVSVVCQCSLVNGCRPTFGKMHCKYAYLSYSQLCYRLEQIGIFNGYAFDIKSSDLYLFRSWHVSVGLLLEMSPLFPTKGHVRLRINRPPLDLVIVDVFVLFMLSDCS